MADSIVNHTTVIFDNNDYKFKTTGQVLIFDGYLKVYKDYESSEEKDLPQLSKDQTCTTKDVEAEQHYTKPPARYTEASLIKALEEEVKIEIMLLLKIRNLFLQKWDLKLLINYKSSLVI